MPYPEELKQVLIQHIKTRGIKLGIDGRIYNSEELAQHISNETDIGKKLIEIVLRGTIERLGKQ